VSMRPSSMVDFPTPPDWYANDIGFRVVRRAP